MAEQDAETLLESHRAPDGLMMRIIEKRVALNPSVRVTVNDVIRGKQLADLCDVQFRQPPSGVGPSRHVEFDHGSSARVKAKLFCNRLDDPRILLLARFDKASSHSHGVAFSVGLDGGFCASMANRSLIRSSLLR